MPSALIGYTGFVGSNLDRQHAFDDRYNSKNINAIAGKSYDLIVCAGIQAKKWWASEHPDEEWEFRGQAPQPRNATCLLPA
jgi:hypothetical protein